MLEWPNEEIRIALGTAEKNFVEDTSRVSILRQHLNQISADNKGIRPVLSQLLNLRRLFVFKLPAAPGVYLAGGELPSGDSTTVASPTGTGFSIEVAISRLAGETAELVAITSTAKSRNPQAPVYRNKSLDNYTHQLLDRLDRTSTSGWQHCENLYNGQSGSYPTDLCLGFTPLPCGLPPLSEGVASHSDRKRAVQHAFCERIERHALAMWWFHKSSTVEISCVQKRKFYSTIESAAMDDSTRSYRLLNISLDWGPSVFVALSFNSNGFELALGLGCNLDPLSAIEKSVLELCQMEFALLVARSRATSVSVREEKMIERADRLNVYTQLLSRPAQRLSDRSDLGSTRIVDHLYDADRRGIELFCLDLCSNPEGIFVVKVVSAQLLSPVRACTTDDKSAYKTCDDACKLESFDPL